jgi:hypothetical protein
MIEIFCWLSLDILVHMYLKNVEWALINRCSISQIEPLVLRNICYLEARMSFLFWTFQFALSCSYFPYKNKPRQCDRILFLWNYSWYCSNPRSRNVSSYPSNHRNLKSWQVLGNGCGMIVFDKRLQNYLNGILYEHCLRSSWCAPQISWIAAMLIWTESTLICICSGQV